MDPELPDLGNTRIAFAAKSDRGLLQAYWLFRVIGNPTLTAIGSTLTKVAMALRLPIKGMVKATIFKQFCGGETVEESMATARELAASGIGTILDYSVEGLDDEDSLDATTEEVLHALRTAKDHPHIPFAVFKPTGIARTDLLERVSTGAALDARDSQDRERVQQRFDRICEAAHNARTPVLVDAEESWLQLAIDELVEGGMKQWNKERAIVFNTIQLYRHDRLEFLRKSIDHARANGYHLGVKLVRGAYMEKERAYAEEHGLPDPIQPNKAASDRDYDAALELCLANIDQVAVMAGTHNESSTLLMARLMRQHGIARNDRRVWSAQLLGMSDNISFNMAAAGYNVAKYVPYGPVRKVLPYLIRRANENTSARGQTGRELGLIIAERRKRRETGR